MTPRTSSPATELHEVAVCHDQTQETWTASRAAIERGRIVVAGSRVQSPPDGMFDAATSTFTITATDGSGRTRRFSNVIYDRGASQPPRLYVFV
jgi:hypothetical protein